MDKAILYEQFVSEVLSDEPQKSDEFLKLFREIRDNGIEKGIAIEKICELVKGNDDLLIGLKDIYPEADINIPPEATDEPFTLFEAFIFTNKIKTRFEGGDNEVYETFLNILKMYEKGEKPRKEMFNEVFALFENHQDLIAEFCRFAPRH